MAQQTGCRDSGVHSSSGNGGPKSAGTQPVAPANFERQIHEYVNHIHQSRNRKIRSKSEFSQIQKSMELVYGRNTRLFCVDIEAWERNTQIVTEIGVSIYDPQKQAMALLPVLQSYHIIIKQLQNKRNGRYVPDHMHNFMEGQLMLLPLLEAKAFLQCLIDKYFGKQTGIACVFVGHDVHNDVDYLAKIGVRVPKNVPQLDTQKLFACSHGLHGASLLNALRTVKQPFAFLHNAGNDAYYTVLLALRLCDPNVRLMLGLDLLADGEQLGDRKNYLKTPANTSVPIAVDFRAVLRQLDL
ncbi:hypothetical protein METBIDRAFT_31467 [Metschnikowia bicuspidata var. bicuspidata NRRL YB-4993]|uniref:Gfd2/YDR514C-like C-terminal domain-containing protein n=1 Tax=Metschnikowia bicuspidata var. bicuspidata NRRL YB-4993 TaxID=869754 RepID=A0A1A0HEN9_9ASCO|nr:hypothetical protein METBIDRAFT_31467 [Metschnikowia bicuspidata var. bicuspidata NRRL YB-4993]OBA22589.1 hypothetical protein METBIDRAFT_31467 [Metschnikowia bicuspidata var. bicuspidata NRRL YB-4993]